MWVERRPFILKIFRHRFNTRQLAICIGCIGSIRRLVRFIIAEVRWSYSFGEANQKKYVLVVEAEAGQTAQLKEVELTKGKKLLRKRADGIEEALSWLTENQDCLVELTVVTDTYLTAMERKQLSAVHSGIVAVIPEVKNGVEHSVSGKGIDLSKNMNELFVDYFRHGKGQEPNDEMIKLFAEILAEDEE